MYQKAAAQNVILFLDATYRRLICLINDRAYYRPEDQACSSGSGHSSYRNYLKKAESLYDTGFYFPHAVAASARDA